MKLPDLETYLSRQLEIYLDSNGLNRTSERFEILRAVVSLDQSVEPFSARDLHNQYLALGGQAGRACIYQTLSLLEKAGIVVRTPVLIGTGIGYLLGYRFGNSIAHLCLYCNKINLYKRSRFVNTLSAINPKDTTAEGKAVFLYGACKQCRRVIQRNKQRVERKNSRRQVSLSSLERK